MTNRNAQTIHLQNVLLNECYVQLNSKQLGDVCEISPGGVSRILTVAHKNHEVEAARIGRPASFTSTQEQELIRFILDGAGQRQFMEKRELLDGVDTSHKNVLTYSLVHRFMEHDHDVIHYATVHPNMIHSSGFPKFFLITTLNSPSSKSLNHSLA
jgi:hypothetical protein